MNNFRFQFPLFFLLSLIVFLSFGINSADAATRTWTGTSSNLWDVDANWGGTKPVAGDDLVFPALASNKSTSNNMTSATSFNSITFEGTGYTLAGNSITLPAGGITSNISGGPNTISLAIALSADTTISLTYDLTISGIISGAFVLNKTGAGTLTLSGDNSFSGGLTVLKSKVNLSTSANAAGTGSITLGNSAGGSDDVNLNSAGTLTFTNPIILASNTTGTLSISNTVSASSWNTIFTGGVTGNNDLTVNNIANNIASITFSTGSINNVGTVTNSGSGNGRTIISAVIGTNVTGVIQNSETSVMTLSGNNTFTSGVTVLKGTLMGTTSANAFGADAINGAGRGTITLGNSSGGSDAVTLIGGNSLTFANPIVLASNTTGTLTINNSNSGSYSPVFSGGVTGTNNLNINNAATNSASITFSTGSINNVGTVTNMGAGSNAPVTISAIIGSNVTEVIQDSSTSLLTLSGNNTFDGLTILKGTVIGLTSANALGTGTVTLGNSAGGSDDATLKVSTHNLTFTNPIVLASNTTGVLMIRNNGNQNITFTGGVTGANNLVIYNSGSSSGININFTTTQVNNTGTISNSGTGINTAGAVFSSVIGSNVTEVIQDSSTSLLTLSGNNTFDGLTILSGRVIGSTSANAFGTGSVTLGNSAGGSDGATLAAGTGSLTFANPIVLASNTTGTLTIYNYNGNNSTFTGGVTGNNNLSISNGASSVGQNLTFATGSINNSGTVTHVSPYSNPAVFITAPIGSNVTGIIQNSTAQSLTVSGEITVNGSGTTLTNSATTRTLTISGGVVGTGNLIINNDSTTANGITISTASVNNVGTITNSGTGSGSVALSSVIGSNVTGLTQNSATSQLTLSGNDSTISGDVTITSGTLELSGTTNLNVSGGWSNSGTFTANQGTVTLTTGSHTISGANTFYNLTINPSNTVTFATTTTQTISNNFSCSGTSGNTITINSSEVGTQATLSKSSGTVDCDYLLLTDSDATGGATWNAGDNSIKYDNVTGWLGGSAGGGGDGGSGGAIINIVKILIKGGMTFKGGITF